MSRLHVIIYLPPSQHSRVRVTMRKCNFDLMHTHTSPPPHTHTYHKHTYTIHSKLVIELCTRYYANKIYLHAYTHFCPGSCWDHTVGVSIVRAASAPPPPRLHPSPPPTPPSRRNPSPSPSPPPLFLHPWHTATI